MYDVCMYVCDVPEFIKIRCLWAKSSEEVRVSMFSAAFAMFV